MNGDEVVWDCLRKHGTDEDALSCIRCYGADESVLQALREFGAGEEPDNASNALRDYRHRKYAADEALEKARCRKSALDSIEDSPVWKDPRVLTELSQRFMAKDFEKSRETTKHYIDHAGQPATGPKSRMGEPRRGADGQVLRDARGSIIWDEGISSGQFDPASAGLRKAQQGSLKNCGQCAYYNQDKTCQIVAGPVSADLTCDKFGAIPAKPVSLVYGAASRDSVQRKNVTADGKINPNKSLMGTPKLNADGSITWEVNDEPKPRPVNVRADGKIDATKSIMGNPKLNPDGSITWT
jgi:hypothetical protein